MKWILKAVVQKVISGLPASQKINYWFQKNITKGVILSDQHFSDKLTSAIDHLYFYKKYCNREGFTALELGSGWYPVVPVALFLAGAREVQSIDISSLMNRESIQTTLLKYREWAAQGKLGKLQPFIKEERWEVLEELAAGSYSKKELLSELQLNLLITDARNTGFENQSFDLICSNNTYEHIYPHILDKIITEFQRVLKPGGVNSHFIDMSDHFAHLDDTISIYNFLRFSPEQWRWIDNSVQPQNRLRKKDYEKLYTKAGIEILESQDRPGDEELVAQENLHPSFSENYTLSELAISHTHLVSSKG